MFSFNLIKKDPLSKARAGEIHTDHGTICTPIFMPVGTQGTVKAVSEKMLKEEVKAQIILSNTYHLYLRPGTEILEKAGGLHRFMHWDRPVLTDSGGFQVYSLSALRKLKQDGVQFKSHIDGSKHYFSPEIVVGIQRSIGSDIMMCLDECTPYPCDYEYAKKSNEMTTRWAALNRNALLASKPFYGHTQAQFGIIQGSVYPDLREQSARDLTAMDFEGYAIGGLAVGEPAEKMYEIVDLSTDCLPEEKPRYLMGVGRPENILEAIERGVDMFDCVMPTRNARNTYLFTHQGVLGIKNHKFADDFSPVDEECECYACRNFSRAYLRHLFAARELLAYELASIHNLAFYLDLVGRARKKIQTGEFTQWKAETLKKITKRI